MTRGRPPKPSTLAWLSGDRKRKYIVEPEPPAGAPQCPDYLDDVAKAEWKEITAILKDMGLLSRADRAAIELYCEAYSRYRKAQAMVAKAGAVIPSPDKRYPLVAPWHTVLRQAAKDMTQLLLQFGLTPSARARMGQDLRTQDNGGDVWERLVG